MDVSSIAALATNLQSARLRDDIGTTVLKKAMDINAAAAAQLIASIPAPPSAANLPPNLGQTINTTA